MIDFDEFARRGKAAQTAVDRLVELANPTGGKHTPTPWRKGEAVSGSPAIVDQDGMIVAMFEREADRDLALYFTNIHAAFISMLRAQAQGWQAVAMGNDHSGFKEFARQHAELLHTYADLFCRLGKPEEPQ